MRSTTPVAMALEGMPLNLGGCRTLAEDDAARAAHVLDAARTVTCRCPTGRPPPRARGILGQRPEEVVDRQREAVTRIASAQQKMAAADDHFLHRRQEIDRVGLDTHPVLRLPDRQRCAPPEQLVHQALEIGRQVLQHHEAIPVSVGRWVNSRSSDSRPPADAPTPTM